MKLHVGLAVALGITTSACTHWSTSERPGQRREVARRLVGEPMIEEVTTHNVAGGVAGGVGGGGVAGAGSAQLASVKRRRCVQPADVDYVQSVELTERLAGRKPDMIAGGALATAGILMTALLYDDWQAAKRDPILDDDAPVGPFMFTGAVTVGGLTWLSYPFWPRRAPRVRTEERRWTAREYVDATGCASDAP